MSKKIKLEFSCNSEVKSMNFHLINVVWGEAYTKLLLDVCLPTQLAPGNIAALEHSRSVYKIYTTAKDAETITKHPIYSALVKAINTQIKIFNVPNDYLKQHHHQLMTYCHNHAIIEANRDNSALIILCPDCVWSAQTFANLIKITKTGKRVVVVPSLSVVTETFIPEFLEKFGTTNNGYPIEISSRDLVKISLAHLHPLMKSYTWEQGGVSNTWPSYFHWDVDETGIITRSFRMHPLMIVPRIKNVLSPDPIDSYYISLSCPNLDDFHVVDDSDQVFVANIVKFNKEDWNQNILHDGTKSGITESVAWLKQYNGTHVKPCHRLFFQHKVKIHSQPISAKWKKIEEESDQIVDLIIKGAEQ